MANKTEDTGTMSTEDTLLAFSEWADGQGLYRESSDDRSHQDLAREFIRDWEEDEDRATLAGRVGAKFTRVLAKALNDAANALSRQ